MLGYIGHNTCATKCSPTSQPGTTCNLNHLENGCGGLACILKDANLCLYCFNLSPNCNLHVNIIFKLNCLDGVAVEIIDAKAVIVKKLQYAQVNLVIWGDISHDERKNYSLLKKKKSLMS